MAVVWSSNDGDDGNDGMKAAAERERTKEKMDDGETTCHGGRSCCWVTLSSQPASLMKDEWAPRRGVVKCSCAKCLELEP